MAVKKRGLGRGLDALLGQPNSTGKDTEAQEQQLKDLPVDLIQRGKYQPRRDMDPQALEELANSIRVQGVMQPIVVRPIADGRYARLNRRVWTPFPPLSAMYPMKPPSLWR